MICLECSDVDSHVISYVVHRNNIFIIYANIILLTENLKQKCKSEIFFNKLKLSTNKLQMKFKII